MNEMPRVRCSAGLQEAVVEHLLRQQHAGDEAGYERYRKAADRIYIQYADAESRLLAFRRLYARFFEELGCMRIIAAMLAPLTGRIPEVLMARAWSPSEEGAELGRDGRTLGLRILPTRFSSPSELERVLRHELGHVADMLDPTFEYGAGLVEGTAPARRTLGDRFGLLWDCTVDGRTARSGAVPWRTRAEYEEACVRMFHRLPAESVKAVVGRLWEGERLDYPALVRFAADETALSAWAGVAADEPQAASPVPGGPCPLCGFPTHAWAASFDPQVVRLIQADFPTWQPHQDACERCVEGYAVRLMLSR